MDCHDTYNLDPDYIYDDRTICLTDEGFGVVNPETGDCETSEAIRFPHGTTVRIHNRDSITRTVTTDDGRISDTIAPDGYVVWPENEEDDWYPIGVTTLSSDRNGTLQSAPFTIYHPGALDMSQDTENRGCCRTSIRVLGTLLYGAFQDFAANTFPQYLRFIDKTEYYDYTPTYPVNGSSGTVAGGTIVNTQRYRAPQCMWNDDPYDSETLRRGIFGREELVYTPDNRFHLNFYNAPILGDSPRIEVDPWPTGPGGGGPTGTRQFHYWTVSGTPVLVDDQTEETPIYWRYEIRSNYPEDDGSAACGVDSCDGGVAGKSTRKYEMPYTAGMFAGFLDELVKAGDADDRWKDCTYPNSQLQVRFPSSDDHERSECSGAVGAGWDSQYADMYSWPGSPDTDWSYPGENQPDDFDKFPPPYDCIQYDIGSYLALLPNALPEGYLTGTATAEIEPMLMPLNSIHDEGASTQFPAYITIVKSPSRIEVIYAVVHRWWSAPYVRRVTEFVSDGVNPIVETEISATEDLEGSPSTVAACKRMDDPAEPEGLEALLLDKFTNLPVGGSFSRVISQECPSS